MVFGFAGVTALASIVTGHSGAVLIRPGWLKKTRLPPKPIRTYKDITSSTLAGFCDSFVDIYFRVSDCLATSKGYEEVLAYLHVWRKLPTSFEMDRNAAISC